MTSVALMTAVTRLPSLMPSDSTDERVIAATISDPLTLTTTSAITAPSLTLLTVPASWFLALSGMAAPFIVDMTCWQTIGNDRTRPPGERYTARRTVQYVCDPSIAHPSTLRSPDAAGRHPARTPI